VALPQRLIAAQATGLAATGKMPFLNSRDSASLFAGAALSALGQSR
jgi:hypothetical protein